MSPAVREAVETARTCGLAGARKAWARETVRALAYAVAEALPSEMTLGELVDELSIASDQGGE